MRDGGSGPAAYRPQPPENKRPAYAADVRRIDWTPAGHPQPGAIIRPGTTLAVTDDCPELAIALQEALRAKGIQAAIVDGPGSAVADQVIITAGYASTGLSDRHWAALVQACRAHAHAARLVFLQPLFSDNGLDGLAQTLAQEWPDREIACLSIAEEALADRAALADAIIAAPAGTRQLWPGGRYAERIEQAWQPPVAATPRGTPGLWLVTGGARGVTAACTVELARRTGGHFLLAGRTEIAPWPDGIPLTEDLRTLRTALACEAGFRGDRMSPRMVDTAARAALAGQEIRRTLQGFADAGVTAEYITLDVANAGSVNDTVGQIRKRLGAITGLIHGAGVLADRMALEKSEAELRRVFAPKAEGLINLLNALDLDSLQHLGLFSSASAHFGNRGQSDYAMANAVLINCGRRLARDYRHLSVKVFNWGPWAGGMVDAALAAHFEARGAALIGLEEGARIFADLMTSSDRDMLEALVGSGWTQA